MSASNWAVCPQCRARAESARAAALQQAFSLYGIVRLEEWQAATAAAAAMPSGKEDDFVTFREDYEIYGAETGTVTVSYGGDCEECGLTLSFTDKRPFYDSGQVPQ